MNTKNKDNNIGNLNCPKIAVIDTETNDYDDVISIGCVIVDSSNFDILDKIYLLVYPDCTFPAMYASVLEHEGTIVNLKASRRKVIKYLTAFLDQYKIKDIFAYNARFDYYHLWELNAYNWYDIMKVAAYKQYNSTITNDDDTCLTGRLKRGFGVEAILKRLCIANDMKTKSEVHNALDDVIDEVLIMKLLNHDISIYERCLINGK